MTREEQLNEYLKERNIPVDSLEANSIKEGIDWADENPKADLVSIDKVCEWLENYAELTGIDSETIKESFRKAMEE